MQKQCSRSKAIREAAVLAACYSMTMMMRMIMMITTIIIILTIITTYLFLLISLSLWGMEVGKNGRRGKVGEITYMMGCCKTRKRRVFGDGTTSRSIVVTVQGGPFNSDQTKQDRISGGKRRNIFIIFGHINDLVKLKDFFLKSEKKENK